MFASLPHHAVRFGHLGHCVPLEVFCSIQEIVDHASAQAQLTALRDSLQREVAERREAEVALLQAHSGELAQLQQAREQVAAELHESQHEREALQAAWQRKEEAWRSSEEALTAQARAAERKHAAEVRVV